MDVSKEIDVEMISKSSPHLKNMVRGPRDPTCLETFSLLLHSLMGLQET
jgi:hypothetical protein